MKRFLRARREGGQMLIFFVLVMLVLFLFVGLAVDLGFAYISQAELQKAVDSAALSAVRNLFQTNYTAIAQSVFAMNYGHPGRDAAVVIPTITLVNNPATLQKQLQVRATATINTFFIKLIPAFKTLTVSASAQSLRGPLTMALVIDRSGSMGKTVSQGGSYGGSTLGAAVTEFLSFFDNTVDQAAMVSFATTVRVDFPMARPFTTQISSLATALWPNGYAGGTYSSGGLTNGYAQIVAAPPPSSGGSATKVLIFFTDGMANTIQQAVNCPPANTWEFGGTDSGTSYYVMPTNSDTVAYGPYTGSAPAECRGFTSFSSVSGGTLTPSGNNIRTEAFARAVALAQQMQNAGVTVCCIGLGSGGVDSTFLRQIANDPASTHYNPALPAGIALISPTAADLQSTFQTMAASILERLTQ